MKFSRVLLSLFLLAAATTPASGAVVKPGATCSKVGSVVVQGSLKYKCVNSGKKKVWDKGTRVAPIPTASPTPSASPTPTATPEPFEPTSFDDLVSHPETISYWAWKKSSEQIKKSTATAPEVVIHLGPNTAMKRTNTIDGILAATRLYDSFIRPSKMNVIYFSFKDRAWAQAQYAKYSISVRGTEAEEMCRDENSCGNAMAEIDLKGSGLFLIAIGESGRVDPNENSGTLEAHEFTHSIQSSQFIGTAREQNSHCCFKRYVPHWMVEGGAEFAQAASIFPDSFEKYLSDRKFNTRELLENKDRKFTAIWLEKFLDPESITLWNDQSNNWRIYDVGFLANEALVAMKGPAISLQLHRDIALGASWQEAFLKNFGVTWSEAAPKLAKAIKAQLAK